MIVSQSDAMNAFSEVVAVVVVVMALQMLLQLLFIVSLLLDLVALADVATTDAAAVANDMFVTLQQTTNEHCVCHKVKNMPLIWLVSVLVAAVIVAIDLQMLPQLLFLVSLVVDLVAFTHVSTTDDVAVLCSCCSSSCWSWHCHSCFHCHCTHKLLNSFFHSCCCSCHFHHLFHCHCCRCHSLPSPSPCHCHC